MTRRVTISLLAVASASSCGLTDDFDQFHVVGGDVAPDMAISPDAGVFADLTSVPDSTPDDLTPPDLAPLPDLLPPTPRSCVNLPKTCGLPKNADCCESILVPEGTFFRSYDVAIDGAYPDKSSPATISEFRLDKYEVTVGRFRKMIDAAGPGSQTTPPANGEGAGPMIGTGWDQTWNAQLLGDINGLKKALECNGQGTYVDLPPSPNDNLPINCVSWFEAFAFCVWDGGRLPTEAEWNYAATGGAEQRAYPWSNPPGSTTIDDTLAVYCGATCKILNVGSTSPRGDGRWGHADLSGNVWEWVFDWYAPYGNPCVDCANVGPGTERSLRGGNFAAGVAALRVASRPKVAPLNRDNSSGIRCARGL